MSKICTAAVIGCGSRGVTYSKHMRMFPDRYKIVSICEIKPDRLARFGKEWDIPEENLFVDENEFLKEKRADVLIIATHDRDHVRMAVKALELGYHLLLEKPISPEKHEMIQLLETHKKHPQKVVVCHVLRYAPAYLKMKEIIESGTMGELRSIEWVEQVHWWHQAHSFVRGNWRRDDGKASPMIMQKCCHDLDLLQYYAGDKCESVYSIGDLSFYKKEFQPEGAADRCSECQFESTCVHSAEFNYITRWKEKGCPADCWPFNMCCYDVPLTEEKIRKAYADKNNNYGQCVFACDNSVVDNQVVQMKFRNNVKVHLTMSSFSARGGRKATFRGTNGEINFDEALDFIEVIQFNKAPVKYTISNLVAEDKSGFDHGGGDHALVETLYDMIYNNAEAKTSLEASVESHLIALAAEESRKTGAVVKVHD